VETAKSQARNFPNQIKRNTPLDRCELPAFLGFMRRRTGNKGAAAFLHKFCVTPSFVLQ
jgi:hypothetical protein